MKNNIKIGILGCGNMGAAIAKAAVFSGLAGAENLYLYDIDKNKSGALKSSLNANTAASPQELCRWCNAIILAIKPQDINDALRGLREVIDSSKLVISILAGVTIRCLKQFLKEETKVVRVMPNIALSLNAGMSCVCPDHYAGVEDINFVKQLFAAAGDVIEVREELMDAVTAISGSGPAYFFYLAEILEQCAVEMGIEKEKAAMLAVKTALGSALLLARGEASAESLRRSVTSKGGATEAAFRHFTQYGLKEIVKGGVEAARKRSQELSGG